jgi:hypothetical protein
MIFLYLASGSVALLAAAVTGYCFGVEIPGLERMTLFLILTALTSVCVAMLFHKPNQEAARNTKCITRLLFAAYALLPAAIYGAFKLSFHWTLHSMLVLNLLALALVLDSATVLPAHIFSRSFSTRRPTLWLAWTANCGLLITLLIALTTSMDTWIACSIFGVAYVSEALTFRKLFTVNEVHSADQLKQRLLSCSNWYPEICWTGSAWHAVTTQVPVEGSYKTVERQESVYQGGHPIESFNGYVTRTHFDKVWVPPSTRAVTSRVVTANWEHVFKYGKYTNSSDPDITSILDNLLANTPCFLDVKFLWNWKTNSDTEEYQNSKEAFKNQLAEQDVHWDFDESVYAIRRDGRQRVSNFRAGVGSDWQRLWMRLGFSFYILSVALGLGALFRLMWHRHFKSFSINLVSAPSI